MIEAIIIYKKKKYIKKQVAKTTIAPETKAKKSPKK